MWLSGNTSNTQTTFDTFGAVRPDGNMTLATSNGNYLASIRGRVGWVGGQWLVYATGGAAWTNARTTATWVPIAGALAPAPSASTVSFDGNKTGFVVGAGVERMLSPHWVVRAEYLYYGFNGSSGTLPFLVPAGNGCTPAGACVWNVNTSRLNFNTARVGVSYLFGGPVVAKY
jgi:outer membrane immunogenic protein